jgi:enoyl-CoA hydratase
MPEPLVCVTEDLPIAVVELNRKEKRNALNVAMRDALEQELIRLEADDRVKVVVLWGGPDCFCAGFDLQEMLSTSFQALLHRAAEFQQRTLFYGKPLVTAVAGAALAGGFDLATGGDVIVAAEDAELGRVEVQWGANPTLCKLALRIGMARAVQLSLSGERFSAARAKELGVVDRVVPRAQLMEAAMEEARRLSVAPLQTILAVKRASIAVPFLDARAALDLELGLGAQLAVRGPLAAQLAAYTSRTLKK